MPGRSMAGIEREEEEVERCVYLDRGLHRAWGRLGTFVAMRLLSLVTAAVSHLRCVAMSP